MRTLLAAPGGADPTHISIHGRHRITSRRFVYRPSIVAQAFAYIGPTVAPAGFFWELAAAKRSTNSHRVLAGQAA